MQKRKHIQPIQRLGNLNTKKKLLIVLGVAVLLVLGIFTWNQYQDAQNKEFLEQIAADFSSLQTSLEQELGIEVENKSGCFTTSEKFNEGKTACYFRLERKNNDENIGRQLVEISSASNLFTIVTQFRNTPGYSVSYGGLFCTIAATPQTYATFSLECPLGVRAGNADFVRELF